MPVTDRRPTVEDVLVFNDIPGQTWRITEVFGSDAFHDGWGYIVRAVNDCGTRYTTTLLEAEYGTATGWEYAR